METSALVVGTVGDHVRSFPAAHRDSNDTPVTTMVSLTVPMSHEDIEGALWQLLRDEGVSFDDLADDGNATWMLLDSIVGRGTAAVESYRLELADLTPADPAYPQYLRLRRRVEALIGPRPSSRRTRRRRTSVPSCSALATDIGEDKGQQAEGSHGGHRAPLLISPSHNPQPGTRTQEEVRA